MMVTNTKAGPLWAGARHAGKQLERWRRQLEQQRRQQQQQEQYGLPKQKLSKLER
jgi:hypothetical protein